MKFKVQVDEEFGCCLAKKWQLYMAGKVGDVDKIKSNANFFKWPLALYLEGHGTFLKLTDMTMTRDEDIDLESGDFVPVAHILKFDFVLEIKINFQNFESILTCSKFSRQLKN